MKNVIPLLAATLAAALAAPATAFAQSALPAGAPWWERAASRAVARRDDTPLPGGMGATPSPAAAYARNARLVVSRAPCGERPATLLLTDYLPPVRAQGKQGSCAAWSTAYYNYTYCVARRRQWDGAHTGDPRFEFSPAFLYHQGNNGTDHGMPISRAFELLAAQGCATLADMPYDEKDPSTPPSDTAKASAQRFEAQKPASLFTNASTSDTEKLKTYLYESQQTFVMAIPIFADFPRKTVAPDFVYDLSVPAAKENLLGTHAITVVGYDDAKKAFRIVNSWGTKWGDKGFLWIAEGFVKTYAFDGWSAVPGGLAARGVGVGAAKMPHVEVRLPR